MTLQIALSRKELERILRVWHFDPSDLQELESLYRAMVPLLEPVILYRTKEVSFYPGSADCLVTLGAGVDSLIALYEKQQAISEAYMVDCLAAGILEHLYHQLEKELARALGCRVESWQFPGSGLPLSEMNEILDALLVPGKDPAVKCNENYILSPTKSVVMRAVLVHGKDGEESCADLCGSCTNESCRNRHKNRHETKEQAPRETPAHLNYGYRRIFGS